MSSLPTLKFPEKTAVVHGPESHHPPTDFRKNETLNSLDAFVAISPSSHIKRISHQVDHGILPGSHADSSTIHFPQAPTLSILECGRWDGNTSQASLRKSGVGGLIPGMAGSSVRVMPSGLPGLFPSPALEQ